MIPRAVILYVEDDQTIAEMYRIGLRRAGYELLIAPDWPAGLELLRSRHFDLVLLDVMLPGPDGLQALAEIRSDPAFRDLPVAILSNSDMSSEIHASARELGILAWQVKSKSPPPQVARLVGRWLKAASRLTPARREA